MLSSSSSTAAEASGSADADGLVTLTGAQIALQSGESGEIRGVMTFDLFGRVSDGGSASGDPTVPVISWLHLTYRVRFGLVPGSTPTWDYDPLDSLTFEDAPDDSTNSYALYLQPFSLVGDNSDTLQVALAGPAVGGTTGYGQVCATYHADWRLTSNIVYQLVV